MEKEIKKVFEKLQQREINPSGHFDSAGRFWLKNSDLVDVREPSRAYPFSHMKAGRTLKYVKAVAEKYSCNSYEDLLKNV